MANLPDTYESTGYSGNLSHTVELGCYSFALPVNLYPYWDVSHCRPSQLSFISKSTSPVNSALVDQIRDERAIGTFTPDCATLDWRVLGYLLVSSENSLVLENHVHDYKCSTSMIFLERCVKEVKPFVLDPSWRSFCRRFAAQMGTSFPPTMLYFRALRRLCCVCSRLESYDFVKTFQVCDRPF